MITDKIKALFQFIEFLHSNTENFKQFDEVIEELHLLGIERDKLNPQNFFTDKLKYDEIQAKIKEKSKIIEENIIQGIQSKILELNICDLNKTETLWNWNISEIRNLKEHFSEEDIPEILRYKSKYIEYRKATNCDYYFKPFFLQNLDRILKVLFDFFSDTTKNEFEAMEAKAIKVNSWQEALEQFQKGSKKVFLPNDFLNTNIGVGEIDNTLPLGNVKVNFIDTYNKEVTPERKEQLKAQLENYRTIQEKISFLKQEKFNYLQSITPETFEVSGSVIFPNFEKGQPLFFDRYIQIEIDRLEHNLPPQQTETKTEREKKTEFIPNAFTELFVNPVLIDSCLSLLKDIERPCINVENQFVRNKGIFVVWFNVLESKRMFNCHFKNDAERAATLNHNFSGLNISQSLFGKENKRATEMNKSHFETEIAALKTF